MKQRKTTAKGAAICAACAALFAVWPATEIFAQTEEWSTRLEIRKRELARLTADLNRLETDAARKRAREADLVQRVVATDRQAGITDRYVRRLSRELASLEREIASSQDRIVVLDSSLKARRKNMAERMRFMYMHARRRERSVIWSANSVSAWISYRRYLDAINRHDAHDIREIRRETTELADTRHINIDQSQYRQSLLLEHRGRQAELVQYLRQRRRMLNRVRRSRRLTEQTVREMTSEKLSGQRLVETYLSMYETQYDNDQHQTRSFADLRGVLRWPSEGDVLSGYGRRHDARTRTVTRSNGVDIGLEKGSAVRAVAAGEVVRVDWFRGYGLFVMIHHGEHYFTLYAHLEEALVRIGDGVDAGQILARSGDSGALGVSKLHFELWHRSKALDPQAWLTTRG